MKRCNKCNTWKRKEDFYNSSYTKDGKAFRCKECEGKARRKSRGRFAYRERLRNIKDKYGMTSDQLVEMMDRQRGCCSICEESLYDPSRNDMFQIDHDHKTGDVRGLLCLQCNALLGQSRESVYILRRAIEYLEVH